MGGTLYLNNIQAFEFLNSRILDSMAYLKGGALYIKKVQYVSIKQSSIKNSKVVFDSSLLLKEKDNSYTIT